MSFFIPTPMVAEGSTSEMRVCSMLGKQMLKIMKVAMGRMVKLVI
jgi:hypothetical protein